MSKLRISLNPAWLQKWIAPATPPAGPDISILTGPVVVYSTDVPAKAINLMTTSGFRHIPVLDVDDKLVGVLGPRRLTRYLNKHFLNG